MIERKVWVENFDLADTETTTDNTVTEFKSYENLDFLPRPIGKVTSDTRIQTDIEILLKSLDITKNTNIDKKDHTTITGTDDKDYIVGSPTNDLICSEGGPDVIFSDDGVDVIFANGGQDTFQDSEIIKYSEEMRGIP